MSLVSSNPDQRALLGRDFYISNQHFVVVPSQHCLSVISFQHLSPLPDHTMSAPSCMEMEYPEFSINGETDPTLSNDSQDAAPPPYTRVALQEPKTNLFQAQEPLTEEPDDVGRPVTSE